MQLSDQIPVTKNRGAAWDLGSARFSAMYGHTFIAGLLRQITFERPVHRRAVGWGPTNSTLMRDMAFEIFHLPQLKHQQHPQLIRIILLPREVTGPEALDCLGIK
jgi:hypothetical protein